MVDFLSQAYLGNTVMQYALFLATVIVFLVAGKIIYYISKGVGRKLTAKSRAKIDDVLLDVIEEPIVFGMVILGLVLGYGFLTFSPAVDGIFLNIVNILIILAVAWFAIKLIDSTAKEYFLPAAKGTDSKLAMQLVPVITKAVKAGVIFIAFIVILNSFGYDITAILAGLGIGGLAFAFAAKETISDVFGGFSIFTSKPFVVGDWVEIGGIVGVVEEVGLRHTKIRNLDKRLVIIPNSQVAGAKIENISSAPSKKITANIGVTYSTSYKKLKQAMALLKKAVESNKACEKEPLITFSEFKDFSLNILLIYYIKKGEPWIEVKGKVNEKIKELFDRNRIEFAFPTQTVYVKK